MTRFKVGDAIKANDEFNFQTSLFIIKADGARYECVTMGGFGYRLLSDLADQDYHLSTNMNDILYAKEIFADILADIIET